MDRVEIAIGLAAVVFISLVLSGLWSLIYKPYCGVLSGYVILGIMVGAAALFAKWYRQLETIAVGLLLLALLAFWLTYANPAFLFDC